MHYYKKGLLNNRGHNNDTIEYILSQTAHNIKDNFED